MDRWEDHIDVDDSDLFSVLLDPHSIPSCSSSHQALSRSLHPCSQNPRSSKPLHRNPSPPSQSQFPIVISEANQIEVNLNLQFAPTSRPLIPGPAGAIQAAMRRESAVAAAKCSPLEDSERVDLCVREEDEDFKLNPWLCALRFLGKDSSSSLSHPISSINTKGNGTKRIPQVIGIVKHCRPNGSGDLFITLKDPKGTIDATVHRKVLLEGNFGEKISLGCVFILKQVVAFCPAHSQCHLNITLKNVVKLIPKDCGPPEKQIVPPFTVIHGAEGSSGDLSFNSRNTANVQSKRIFIGEGMVDSRKAFLPESSSGNICAAAASASIALRSRTQMNEPKRLISGASVGEWTDEQLEKLFSEYDDDFF